MSDVIGPGHGPGGPVPPGGPERPRRRRCVGAIVFDDHGRLLVIRRANPPGRGLWSIPGGRVEAGETDHEAVVRELREETGLVVGVGRHVGSVQRAGPQGTVYDIHDYLAFATAGEPAAGEPAAGDDALDARWVTGAELRSLPTTPGLIDALAEWGCLPRT